MPYVVKRTLPGNKTVWCAWGHTVEPGGLGEVSEGWEEIEIDGQPPNNWIKVDWPNYFLKEQFIADDIVAKHLQLLIDKAENILNIGLKGFIEEQHFIEWKAYSQLTLLQSFEGNKEFCENFNQKVAKNNETDITNGLVILKTCLETYLMSKYDASSIMLKQVLHDNKPLNKNIFIVHGHDEVSKLKLEKILKEEFYLNPIILSDVSPSSFGTIFNKFEEAVNDCYCAIVLMTPDDQVVGEESRRARQNVIFELGYFCGMFSKLHPKKILIIRKTGTEDFSDLRGVEEIRFNTSIEEIGLQLQKQLKKWGYY